MADKAPGFAFNQQFISYALGILALLSAGFGAASWINDRTHFESDTGEAIVMLKEADSANASANERLAGEVGRLSDSVDALALSLKEVEVIQRNSPMTGYNETAVPNLR